MKKRFNIIDKWSKKSNEHRLTEWAKDIKILLPVVFVVDGLVWDFQLIDFFSSLNNENKNVTTIKIKNNYIILSFPENIKDKWKC